MRISIVTGFFLPVPAVMGGSTEKIWHRLAREFAALGHDVTLVSRSWPGFAARETEAGVTYLRIRGSDHSRLLAVNLYRDLFWGMRAARALPPGDCVICNTVSLPIWLRRVKPGSGRVVAVLARIPKGHGRAYGKVDRLFALSPIVAERLLAENSRLAGRIAILPYPIDWALHANASRQSPPPVKIGFIGRIHPEKGIRLLLKAAVRLQARTDLRDWRLEISGPSSVAAGGGGEAWRDALLSEFGETLCGRLAFRDPEFDPRALAQRYGSIDIFCYPSLAVQGETFGVAIAEAMAAGCAPVVSALSCFGGLVRDGDTGLVFDHDGDGAEIRLADALARLVSDGALRASLAQRAQSHVRRFDYAEVGRDILLDLNQLCAHGST